MDMKEIRAIYREAFNWHENHLNALEAGTDEETFWDDTVSGMNEVYNRLHQHPLAFALINAAFEDLERRSKAGGGKENTA